MNEEIMEKAGLENIYGSYAEFKSTLDNVVEKVEEGFVAIGYHLKLARDTEILKESGYANMNEFAEAEYGLDKSAVSRFIAINDRFSENGYSPKLQEQYRGMGRAKLSIMLLLPDGINGEITPAYSKADIQTIRSEVEEEQKVSDLEVLMEGRDEVQEKLENNLQRVLHQLGKDRPEYFVRLWHAYMDSASHTEICRQVMEILAPSGEGMHSIRLQGAGRMMLTLKGTGQPLSLVSLRSGEKETFSWEDMERALRMLMGEETVDNTAEGRWSCIYGEEYPEKENVAPVQPEKRQPKVEKAKTAKNPEEGAGASGGVPDVPEEIGPEQLPKGENHGGGISWKEPEKKERKPFELPPADAEYGLPVGKSQIGDIEGGQRYLILKMHNPYRVGNTLHLQVLKDGEETGEQMDIRITHMTEDHGGIMPGYCVIQFEILPPKEEQIPRQMSMEDMENAEEGAESGISGECEEENPQP